MTLPASGIYKITNLLNGKVYIGQSQNIFKRKMQHFTALRQGHHENKQMQKDWNTNNHGFRWDVVEFCSLDKLNEREHYWIEYYHSDQSVSGYNQGWVPYKRKKKKTQYKQKHYHKTR